MTVDDFAATVVGTLPDGLTAELQALWHDANGDWESAHQVVQDLSSRDAAWVHAYLHRKEGDHSNAGYWYRQAGRTDPGGTLESEWRSIVAALLETLYSRS